MKHVKLFESFINEAKIPSIKDVKAAVKYWKSHASPRMLNNMIWSKYQIFSKPIIVSGSEIGKKASEVLLLGIYKYAGKNRVQYAAVDDAGRVSAGNGIDVTDAEFDNIAKKYGKDLLDPSQLNKQAINAATPWVEDFLNRKLNDYLESLENSSGEGLLGDLTREFMKSADSIKSYKDGTIVLRFLQNLKEDGYVNIEEAFYQVNPEEQEIGFYIPELDTVREVETYRDSKQLIQIIKKKVAAWKKKNIEDNKKSQFNSWKEEN